MNALAVIGAAFLGLAAAIHVYIFYLESIAWTKPSTWKTFGLRSAEDAATVKPMAFNQGFYNLFLALGVIVGLLAFAAGAGWGAAVAIFAAACMVGAALVLVLSSPKLARAAVLQGAAPLLGIVLLLVAGVL